MKDVPNYFFKYTSAKTAKTILSSRKMRWNSPLNFNDPFDCYFSYNFGQDLDDDLCLQQAWTEALYENRDTKGHFDKLEQILNSLRTGYMSKEQLMETAKLMVPDLKVGLKGFVQEERDRWLKDLSTYRIFCVCENIENLLLWAHYADCHKGIAFQLQTDTDTDPALKTAQPVIYSQSPPRGEAVKDFVAGYLLGKKTDVNSYFKTMMLTKSDHWSYEKEWRVLTFAMNDPEASYEDLLFNPKEISKVYLGARISSEDRSYFLQKASNEPFKHLEVYQAHQLGNTFGLRFERIK